MIEEDKYLKENLDLKVKVIRGNHVVGKSAENYCEIAFTRKKAPLSCHQIIEAYKWADHYSFARGYSNGILHSRASNCEELPHRKETEKFINRRRCFDTAGTHLLVTLHESDSEFTLKGLAHDQGLFGKCKGLLLRGHWYIRFHQENENTVHILETWQTPDEVLLQGLAVHLFPHHKIMHAIVRNMADQLSLDWHLEEQAQKLNREAMKNRIMLRQRNPYANLQFSKNEDYWGRHLNKVRQFLGHANITQF